MSDYLDCPMRVVGLYDLQGSVDCLPQAFDKLLSMSRQLSCEPTLMSLAGPLKSFKSEERKARQSNFKGAKGFEFYSLPVNVKNRLNGVSVSASVGFRLKSDVVIQVRESLLPNLEVLHEISREIAKLVRPLYGIGFCQPFRCGPTLFARGMRCPGTAKDDLETLRAHFGNLMYRYYATKGLLSDLFELNFLTAAQLDRPVGDMTFKQWILSDVRERGELSRFTDEMWLWKLTPEQIVVQRPILKAAGRIVDFWHEERLRQEAARRHDAAPLTGEEVVQALVGNATAADVDIVAFGGNQPPRDLTNDEKNALLNKREAKKRTKTDS